MLENFLNSDKNAAIAVHTPVTVANVLAELR